MSTRIESDSIGEIEVAADAYWGAQTERSRHNFAFPAHERMPLPIVHALARIKGAAARVNRAHGLDADLADAIADAAEAVVAGRYDDQVDSLTQMLEWTFRRWRTLQEQRNPGGRLIEPVRGRRPPLPPLPDWIV